jgi:endoglucanase
MKSGVFLQDHSLFMLKTGKYCLALGGSHLPVGLFLPISTNFAGMKRKILSITLLFFCCLANVNGQLLKAKGIAIVRDNGDTVLLRGMGLGGWMLQEGYMFRLSNLGQQYKIKEKINELIGQAKVNEFYDQWLLNHTTKADIDSMAAWGFNSVRLPMHYGLFTLSAEEEQFEGQNTWLSKGFEMTDSLLSWCKANKMYLILDLHAAPGGQGNDLPIADRNPLRETLWDSKADQAKTIALWKKLAQRYANEPWIGAYDILNEPNYGFEDPKNDFRGINETKNVPLRELMVAITKAIREVDKKHIVIIEGNGFGNNYRGIMPPWDTNMVLSFHKYGNFNTTEAIQKFLTLRDTYQVPIWLGETGENSNTWFTEAITLAEKNGIGWAWWQLKKMGINNPLEIKRPEGYEKLLAYWSDKGPRPSEAEATIIFKELISNLRIANNIYHPDVIDAMFRQVHSTGTLPFKKYTIGDSTVIPAVDFDMGRQRYAYYDTDSARYQYTPGVNTDGNKGHVYRNDGVDIKQGENGFYVFSIENGEWMQYTVDVKSAGLYNISFIASAENAGGIISLSDNDKIVVKALPVAVTTNLATWKPSTVKNIQLTKGVHRFRVIAIKGGFSLSGIQFKKMK